jgi:hypothetical protein
MKICLHPFPFPYAQATLVLLLLHWCIMPFVATQWAQEPVLAGIFGFLVPFIFWSLFGIGTELENPFGDKANDMPAHELQTAMNLRLHMLLSSEAAEIPRCLPTQQPDFQRETSGLSMLWSAQMQPPPSGTTQLRSSFTSTTDAAPLLGSGFKTAESIPEDAEVHRGSRNLQREGSHGQAPPLACGVPTSAACGTTARQCNPDLAHCIKKGHWISLVPGPSTAVLSRLRPAVAGQLRSMLPTGEWSEDEKEIRAPSSSMAHSDGGMRDPQEVGLLAAEAGPPASSARGLHLGIV